MQSTPKPVEASTKNNVYAFGVTSFLNDVASEMAYWILPAFLLTLGAGPAQLGLIEGIAESVAAGAKLFSGYLTDRLTRRKPVVVAGYAVANIAKPFLAMATVWWHVLIIRFSDRISKGIRGAPRDVMLAESTEQGKMGSAFGLMQAMDSAGAIVGPLLALWMLTRFSVRSVFWAAAVPGFLSITVVSLFARETGKRRTLSTTVRAESEKSAPTADKPIPTSFYYMLFAVCIFSLGNSSDMFLILRAQEAGIAPRFAPVLGLVFNIVYTVASWPAGRLADRLSKKWIAAAGYLVFALTYFVFAKAPSTNALWIAMAGYGFYYSLTDPVLRALVVSTVPAESRGRALGTFYFATSVATLLASLLTGYLWRWKHAGQPVPLYISSALALLAAGLLVLVSPRNNKLSVSPASS
jgi:MFS family permease